MTEQNNRMQEQEPQKKPIALAVTLILLVISLIFVILFSAKNISYKQELQVTTGNDIVEHFKQLDRKLNYLQSNIALIIDKADSWDESAVVASTNAQYLIEDVYGHLADLYELGHRIRNEKFGMESKVQLEKWHNAHGELMQQLATSSELVNSDYLNLQLLKGQVDRLQETIGQFNFKMEGNKNAMIRLSSGFDWMELVEKMSQVAVVEEGQ